MINAKTYDGNLCPVSDSRGKRVRNLFVRNGNQYYFRGEFRGREFKRSCPYETQLEAARWVKKFRRALRAGQDPLAQEPTVRAGAPSIGRLLELYDRAARRQYAIDGCPAPATARANARALLLVVGRALQTESPGLVNVTNLTRELAEEYIQITVEAVGEDYEKRRRARLTAGSTLRQAKSVFTAWAVRYYGNHVSIPECVEEFRKTGKVVRREKYQIPPKELRVATMRAARELKDARPDLNAVFILCYECGLRAGEAREARWEWFEGEKGSRLINIRRRSYWKGPKNLVPHAVPVSEEAYSELCACRNGSEFIIPADTPTGRRDLIAREFAAWMRAVGWNRETYPKAAHELRKLAGSEWYTKAGIEWAAKWLGDSHQTAAHFYADLSAPPVRVAMR